MAAHPSGMRRNGGYQLTRYEVSLHPAPKKLGASAGVVPRKRIAREVFCSYYY